MAPGKLILNDRCMKGNLSPIIINGAGILSVAVVQKCTEWSVVRVSIFAIVLVIVSVKALYSTKSITKVLMILQ